MQPASFPSLLDSTLAYQLAHVYLPLSTHQLLLGVNSDLPASSSGALPVPCPCRNIPVPPWVGHLLASLRCQLSQLLSIRWATFGCFSKGWICPLFGNKQVIYCW